ncbi:phage tail tip lysozyme [Vagococcus salmoninarum]|uniref:phage tail tip lysozyme n=1 Tax=Vagococcus salmoninarum TaxID=2739 RepID=UPI001882C8C7|nr:phage tail tip lysozyme [Vagococcus salmoninarum]MBE9390329.1 peptidoglycan DD-metalloendopeptidase family protein [Vagococcus salmoninarum]
MIENIYLYKSIPSDLAVNGDSLIDWVAEPEITRQINGSFGLFGTYSLKGQHVELIKKGAFVKARWENDTWQYFEVRDTKKDLTTLSINAVHIGYMANRNFIENSFTSNGNGQAIMNNLKKDQSFTQRFNFKSTVSSHHQFTAKQVNTIDAIIGSNNGQQNLVGVTGGELDMDNFNLNLKEKIGQDNGYRIDFGINLESIEEHTDDISVVNSLYLVGAVPEDADYDSDQEPITFSFLNVSGVTDANRRIGKRENQECKTVKELKDWGQSLFDVGRIHEPKVTHEVNMIMLENTEEYKDLYDKVNRLGFGDTAHVMLKELEIEVVERMVACVWLPRLSKYKEVTLGNELSTYTSSVNTAVQDVVNKLESKSEQLLNAVVNATNWITGTVGGYVRFRPKNAPSEILIMDTDNVATAKKVWRWNLGGLGYSNNGVNGPFELAMTQDGVFVADFIKAGTIQADIFESSFNKTGDTLKLVKGTLQILNQKNKIMELTKNGLEFWHNSEPVAVMGTKGRANVGGIAWTEEGTQKAVIIDLKSKGEFIQFATGQDTGPNDKYGLLMFKDGSALSKSGVGNKSWLHAGDIDVREGDVRIDGKLFVGGKEVTGGGTGGGGGWNGQYPPEVTSQADKYAWQLWATMIGLGYSKASIAGILGNVQSEAGDSMNPDTEQSGGPAYGCVQWDGSGYPIDNGPPTWNGREYVQRLMKSANIKDNYTTMLAQGKLIDWSGNNGQWSANTNPASFANYKTMTDPKDAALAFELNFEKHAGGVQPKRQADALNWYNKFKDLKAPEVSGKFIPPISAPITVTSEWGYRTSPFPPYPTEFHNGMDFVNGNPNTPIYASMDGEVVVMGNYPDWYGLYVVIKHANGKYTGYAHNSSVRVSMGDIITQGQQIANMGTTGPSTAEHCHFQIMNAPWPQTNDGFENPRPYIFG